MEKTIMLTIWALAMALEATAIRDIRADSLPTSNNTEQFPDYMSNLELETWLRKFSQRCSSISRLYSIGNSVRGKPLLVLEFSDRPGFDEPEPAFKFVGNMHGDEPIGRELLTRLADWLCANHLKDPLATTIVQKLHLHLLPSMNPDGFANRSRNNANDIDLNRDFPDQFFPQNNNETGRQPETVAVMNWIKTNRFVASASLHEGALVANYPWDGTSDTSTKYSVCPDDTTFRFLSSIYSKTHRNMSNSDEFPGGITNGAAWYPLYGGMQDWNYIHGQCLELTLEICDSKWPPANEIPKIWEDNRLSLLELVASTVKTGIHGRVFSAISGLPLAATISVQGYNTSITAGSHFGDYHRLLPPGKDYRVTASMSGYISRSTTILLSTTEPTALDFVLEPLDSSTDGRLAQERLLKLMTRTSSSRSEDDLLPLLLYHFKFTAVCFGLLAALVLVSYFGFRKRSMKSSLSKFASKTSS